ncbi:unnamed protein product [Linum tenue]|uniref:RNase H type-1 domain-containing protein n=1 Tax=Linum tenue TaxID=586396 RepID=A0AAV0IVE0_9ROSI|nr:unnamed protein product [Linum tenue]
MHYLSGRSANLDPSLFAVVCWLLWKNRNSFVFEKHLAAPSHLQATARRLRQQIEEALRLEAEVLWGNKAGEWIGVGWNRPQPGWSCVNTDGSVELASQSSTAGGVVRDDQGHFLGAFAMNLGGGSITRAELMGILQGLRCAWELGVRKVLLQTDSQAAIRIIEAATNTHPHYHIVLQVRRMVQCNWEVRIEHIYRESNMVADFLASTGHDLLVEIHPILAPDLRLHYWLLFDLVGSQTPRLVPP